MQKSYELVDSTISMTYSSSRSNKVLLERKHYLINGKFVSLKV